MNECSENFLLRNDAEHLLPDRRSAAPRRVTVTSSRVKLETRILFSVGVAWESVTDRITIASFQLSTDERLFWGKHRFLSGWGWGVKKGGKTRILRLKIAADKLSPKLSSAEIYFQKQHKQLILPFFFFKFFSPTSLSSKTV